MRDIFLNYLQVERRYSEHTLVAYRKDIEQLQEFIGGNTDEFILTVGFRDIREWVMDMNAKGLTNRSINRKLSSIRAYFKWLIKEEILRENPITKVKGPKTEKRLPSFAKESELKLLEPPSLSDGFDVFRDSVLFELLYQTGIRLSELIDLRDDQVQTGSIRVMGKRNKERQIPISKQLYILLENYKAKRMAEVDKNERFFVLKNGKKLYPKFVYRKINSYLASTTNMDKKSPHTLRHTFATHMLNNGAGLETLKELLGHSNLAATQVYTHNSFSQLSNIYSQAHPRGHKTN